MQSLDRDFQRKSCVTRARRSVSLGHAAVFVFVQLGLARNVLAQDVALEPDRNFTQLIGSVGVGRNGEH